MGYRKITNLQLDHPLFQFKEVYAAEKVHGTSVHLTLTRQGEGWGMHIFSGGIKYPDFIFMMNSRYRVSELPGKLPALTDSQTRGITIYGEGYGGRCQNMGDVYGPLNFVAFEVCKVIQRPDPGRPDGSYLQEVWLDVPRAERFVTQLGLPFVPYERGPATLEWLDAQRNRPSEQAKRNGMGDDKIGEGIVVRAPIEVYDDNGGRFIAKYKREGFRETATARQLTEVEIQALKDAEEIAQEWVVEERLNHVLSALVAKGHSQFALRDTRLVMDAMIEDVSIEAVGKIEWSEAAGRAIGKRAAELFKMRLQTGGITNPIEGV